MFRAPLKYHRRKRVYKYVVAEQYSVVTAILLGSQVETDFFKLTDTGLITAYVDYAWDGPSGWGIDTKNTLRGSLFHDVLYQAMRMGLIPKTVKPDADALLYRLYREDGMNHLRAWLSWKAVNLFGHRYCRLDVESSNRVHLA